MIKRSHFTWIVVYRNWNDQAKVASPWRSFPLAGAVCISLSMDSSFQTGKTINVTPLMRWSYLWRMKRFLFIHFHCFLLQLSLFISLLPNELTLTAERLIYLFSSNFFGKINWICYWWRFVCLETKHSRGITNIGFISNHWRNQSINAKSIPVCSK